MKTETIKIARISEEHVWHVVVSVLDTGSAPLNPRRYNVRTHCNQADGFWVDDIVTIPVGPPKTRWDGALCIPCGQMDEKALDAAKLCGIKATDPTDWRARRPPMGILSNRYDPSRVAEEVKGLITRTAPIPCALGTNRNVDCDWPDGKCLFHDDIKRHEAEPWDHPAPPSDCSFVRYDKMVDATEEALTERINDYKLGQAARRRTEFINELVEVLHKKYPNESDAKLFDIAERMYDMDLRILP